MTMMIMNDGHDIREETPVCPRLNGSFGTILYGECSLLVAAPTNVHYDDFFR